VRTAHATNQGPNIKKSILLSFTIYYTLSIVSVGKSVKGAITMTKKVLFLCLVVFPLPAFATEGPATLAVKTLAARLANQAVVTAYNECSKRGFHVAVALVSREGTLLAFMRSPLAGTHTVEVSQRKAFTAATYQTPTSQMMEREHLKFSPGVLLLGGGLPITIGGHFYGAIAVSGAPAEKTSGDVDEQCARAGIDAIREEVEFAE
jgi:uncharacterized protein GlcG (DUF336 family)